MFHKDSNIDLWNFSLYKKTIFKNRGVTTKMSKRKMSNGPSSTQKRSKGSAFDPDTVRACWEGSGGT